MKTLTRLRFNRMAPAEKAVAYFSHPGNQRPNVGRRPDGPTTVAQAAFTNDWQRAFWSFAETLPLR
jgi:hypothetical protein